MRCWTWMVAAALSSACGPVVADDGGDGGSDEDSTSSAATGVDGTGNTTGTESTATSSTTATTITTTVDPDGSTGGPTAEDLNGRFLLAFAAVIDPGHPLQSEVHVKDTGEVGPRILELEMQALSLEVGATTVPREPVGAPTVVSVEVGDDGAFTVPLPNYQVAGATNPITGGDLLASLVLAAGIRSRDSWCGEGMGTVTQPLLLDLAGSTFAAVRVDDGAPLPDEFPTACP